MLNEHNKEEHRPSHTAEHILNGTVARLYGCGRAFQGHVERKKSKLDYRMDVPLTEAQIRELEERVNQVIKDDLPIWMEYAKKEEVAERFDLDRLPVDVAETVRIVHVGDYDECLCIGQHVEHTSQIGIFRISSYRWQEGVQRIVFRLDDSEAGK